MSKIKRILRKIVQKLRELCVFGVIGKTYNFISTAGYMRAFVKVLEKRGININGTPKYIPTPRILTETTIVK